jgi:hypothetical protein
MKSDEHLGWSWGEIKWCVIFWFGEVLLNCKIVICAPGAMALHAYANAIYN